jgi:hypothetical protein
MNIKSNVLIFSVFQKGLPELVNKMAHTQILSILKRQGFPVLELQGRYNGAEELSILVDGFEHRDTVARLCSEFNQECYLESHNDRATFLVFPNGDTQSIGTLTGVSKQEAEAVGSYSYNPIIDQYFVTK